MKTLMFAGVWFWAGVALLMVAAFGLLTWEPPPPLPDAFESPLSGDTGKYLYAFFGALGTVYAFKGWSRARDLSEGR